MEKDLALQTEKSESAARELDLHRQQLDDFAQHLQAKNEQLAAL